jgi:hypothetical protein
MLGLIATDMPFAAGLLGELASILVRHPTAQAVLPLDAHGRSQPLAAVYRTDALRFAAAGAPSMVGAPLRSLLGSLVTLEVAVTEAWRLRDLDTPADLDWALGQHAAEGAPARPMHLWGPAAGILGAEDERTTMDKTSAWVATAAEALGIAADIDTATVLDVARDVAHGVERPAAPLTTYLLGVAVGKGADPVEAAETLRSLLDDADA